MPKAKKIISFLLCFFFIFEQSGFAQAAGSLGIPTAISGLSNIFIKDKFRPLHLRYLSYEAQSNKFNLLLDKGDEYKGLSLSTTDRDGSRQSANETINREPSLNMAVETLLNYFFIGLILPNSSFWVNLRPDGENNIIDSELARTDVGKILLEADLQLKKDTAKHTSPETPEGKEYWDKLYQKAQEIFGDDNITIPTLIRPWIVPDEIIIREAPNNAYIYKATLKVMLEQDYLKGSALYSFDDPKLKALNEYSSQLIRALIIPKLTREINASKRYAPLRQVYYSLILAQWFKAQFATDRDGSRQSNDKIINREPSLNMSAPDLIDSRNLTGLTSKTPWSKSTYFKAYQKSVKNGEYNIQQSVYTPYGQTIRSYFSGGLVLKALMSQPGKTNIQGNPGRAPSAQGIGVSFTGNLEGGNIVITNGEAPPALLPAGLTPGASQDKTGAMQEGSFTLKEARRRLIADRLGIPFEQMGSWEKANPEKAKVIRDRLEEIAARDDRTGIFLKSIDSKYVIVDRNNPEFTHLYSETEGIVKRLLKAAGFNPENFSFYLLDTTAENAFVLKYNNKIFVNIGLIKFIVENGGSKDAVAFVLAHEIRHIFQWVGDTIEGKPIERGLFGLVSRHADEYDADYALALIDKAGYSVRDAGFFFAKFIEKKGKGGRFSLGFLTHPPTVERLKKIERDVLKFFWLNFFNKSEHFSDVSKQELNNRTRHRLFQHKALSFDPHLNNLFSLMSEASTPEECIFILSTQAENFDLTSDLQRAIKGYFLNRFAANDRTKQRVYEVIIDIVIADSIRKQTSPLFSIGGSVHNYKVAEETRKKFESMSLGDLTELFSIPLILPLMNYRYNKQSQSYQEDDDFFPYFNYTDLIGILCYGLSMRLKMLYRSGQININEMMEMMKLFRQRYLEAHTYARAGIPQDANSLLEELVSMSLQLLVNNKDKTKDTQYLEIIISYFNMFEEIRSMHGGGTLIMADFCSYLKTADESIKQFVLDNWILRGEESSELKGEFFKRMLSIELCDILPGMGKGANSDIDTLFNNPYFMKRIISGYNLANWITVLSKKYLLNQQESIQLYEKVLGKLSVLKLSKGEEERYYEELFKFIGEWGAGSIAKGEMIRLNGIYERIDELGYVPKHIHPELRRLIYFYSLGGILSFNSYVTIGGLRNALLGIQWRSDNGRGLPLKREDVEVFYRYLLTKENEIKQRYSDKTEAEKEMRWAKYVLPLALYVNFDQKALTEEEFRHVNSRFGRFFGEFEYFGQIDRFGSRSDYKKTKVDRGRGINRVFLTGENTDALLQIFDYILTSDKDFEALLNDISKALPATTYRNFALYILFADKFLKQECGISVDMNKMFDLEYIQNIINNLAPQEMMKALQILGRISSLMVRDVEMEQLNEPNQNVLGELGDAEKRRISAEHASEESSYYPFEFTELGGALSQLDIFVGLLAEKSILEALKSTEMPFNEKSDFILKHFTRSPNTRDRFLTLLIENNRNSSTSSDIESILSLFNNEGFREKYAIVALEKKRSENPAEFYTLEGELKWVLHYFPKFSPTRDDILLQLRDEKANKPGDMNKIRPYLLRAPENIREKKQARVVFGTSIFEEYMRHQNAADKTELLLWVLGISEKKPFFVIRFEHEYNVSLNGMRDSFMKRSNGYYKNVGDTAMDEFLENIFLGENGIFYDEKVTAEFLDILFNTLMPTQKNNIMRAFYNATFRRADMNRKYSIVSALLKNFSKERGSPEGISEARAIRIFLESLGLIGVKGGQFLSTYEVIPEAIRNELKLLKDRAPQLGKDIVFDMITKIYGSFEASPISEVLECIGSASIKVVYRARLKDGREIVIKIKRPEVEKKVEEDLAFLRDILSDQAVQDALRDNNIEIPKQLGNRIAEMIQEEMNLRQEVENQDKLREAITSSFRKRLVNRVFNHFISKIFRTPERKYAFNVPATIDVQNNTLIIEDFVKGNPINIRGNDAMIAVARELMRQIFIDGFYHADPHTGNIFVSGEGDNIYFIDVGSASQISFRNRYILFLLMKALQSGDGRKVLSVINKMAGKDMPELTRNANDIAASKENVVKKIIRVFKVLEDSQITVDKELISIFRCFGQGESLFKAALLSKSEGPGTPAGEIAGGADLKEHIANLIAELNSQDLTVRDRAIKDSYAVLNDETTLPEELRQELTVALTQAKQKLEEFGKVDAEETKAPGGIDFRALPVNTQTLGTVPLGPQVKALAGTVPSLDNLDLDAEWQKIEDAVNQGNIPSAESIKEYIQASCLKGSADKDIDKVISCIADILRLEEEFYIPTEPMLMDILVAVESANSLPELKGAFIGNL